MGGVPTAFTHCLTPQPWLDEPSLGRAPIQGRPGSANQLPSPGNLGQSLRSAGWSLGSVRQPCSTIWAPGTFVMLSDHMAPIEYCSNACWNSQGRTQRTGNSSIPCSWGQACDSGCTGQENLHETSTQKQIQSSGGVGGGALIYWYCWQPRLLAFGIQRQIPKA